MSTEQALIDSFRASEHRHSGLPAGASCVRSVVDNFLRRADVFPEFVLVQSERIRVPGDEFVDGQVVINGGRGTCFCLP